MSRHPIFNLQSLAAIIVICLLCAVAVAPLIRSEKPCTHDGGIHYYRVIAMRQALKKGILYTRYLPDLAFGYGFPFFNYRASGSYYLVLVLHLIGFPLPIAQNLLYVLSILGSALAAYLLARDLFGPQAGLVAAIAYAYAPYQFLDALIRGNAPESLALPLMPLILWAFRRLALTGRRRWFFFSVGFLAALYLTHNISSLLFTPLLIAYLCMLWLVYRRQGHWLAVAGALILALSLTAFFWGPALLEKGYVQLEWERSKRSNDFHNNFLTLGEIFAPPKPVDKSLLNPPTHVHLGLVPTVLAGMGVAVGLVHWRDRERRFTLAFFALAAAVMIGMSTSASVWLWERLPLISFVQFPWRLIGRAALPIAILAGAIVPRESRVTHHASRITLYASRLLPFILISLLILATFPATYPPRGYCSSNPYPTIDDLYEYEHRPGGLVGTDPTGAYFPIWVRQHPRESPMEKQYAAGDKVARFDETALPAGASIVETNYGPNRARVVVETPTDFRARYLSFYFPGWRVWIDGEPVEATATVPDGLITFEVPAGHHTIIVRFGETPLRLAADVLSLLSLFTLLVLAFRYPLSPTHNHHPTIAHRSLTHCSLLVLLALALLVFKLAFVDRTSTPFRRPTFQPDGALPGVEHPLNQPYADGMILIGYDQGQTTIPSDDMLRFDLYWTVYTQPSARYQSVIHLVGSDGMRWSLPDTFRPRGYAKYPFTTTWSPKRYALDSQEVELLPGTPPGDYDVVLTTFDRDTLSPLSVLNEQGQPAAPDLLLGQVTLTVPRRPADPDQLGIRNRLDARLGPLTLLGADFDRNEAAPGDPVFVTTFWRAEERPAEDLTLQLELFASDGSLVTRYGFSPAAQWYSLHRWQPGDVWRGQHLFYLPAALDTGDYTWRIFDLQSPTSDLHITAPDRTFTPPPVDLEIDTRLGDTATLLGANLEPETLNLEPNATLTVTLVWRAESETHISYRVFLHLIGPDGRLLAQSDGIPAGWTRPTTGWLSGEYIADAHTLIIPPDAPEGDYVLSTGLYIPGGERLTTAGGSDSVPVATFTMGEQ